MSYIISQSKQFVNQLNQLERLENQLAKLKTSLSIFGNMKTNAAQMAWVMTNKEIDQVQSQICTHPLYLSERLGIQIENELENYVF
jgi:hypothetical protein